MQQPSLPLRLSSLNASPRLTWLMAGLLLSVHFLLGWSSLFVTSPTYDEPAHLTSGLIAAQYGDLRFNPEGGQIAQRWAAIPLLFQSLTLPDFHPDAWHRSTEYTAAIYPMGARLLTVDGRSPENVLLAPRTMILLSSVLFGGFVFLWALRLFGSGPALLALIFYAFSPTILAHGRLVTADLMVSLFFLLALLAIWRTLHKVSWLHVLFAGTSLGGLLLSKHSGLLIIPTTGLLILLRLAVGRPLIWQIGEHRIITGRLRQLLPITLSALMALLMAWLMIWTVYGWRFDASFDPALFPLTEHMRPDPAYPILGWLSDWRLLPQSYLYGIGFTLANAQARYAFMAGDYSITGWRTFFPYAFLVKTSTPFLLLTLALPAIVSVQTYRRGWRWLYRLLPLLVFMLLFSLTAIRSQINIGHRHILPIYPCLAILLAAAVPALPRARSLGRSLNHAPGRTLLHAALAVLTLWHISVALWIWPYFLAYFNPIAGGPRQGYHHLVDSSLDWGQDLAGYDHWLAEQPSQSLHYLAYFSSINPAIFSHRVATNAYSLVPSEIHEDRPVDYRPGYYAISASMLQNVYPLGLEGVGHGLTGHWTRRMEEEYQYLMPLAQAYFPIIGNEEAFQHLVNRVGRDTFFRDINRFCYLRFVRLCSYLRTREPDQHIGYSILIYELSREELADALLGPPDAFVHP